MADSLDKYNNSYAYEFKDREVKTPMTFDMINTANSSKLYNVKLEATPEQIIEEGTPINAATMMAMQRAIFDMVYPVGRGFIDFTDTDFSNYLGFTWERTLVGLVGVGYDPNDTDFNVIGKKGGSKDIQKHTHTVNDPGHDHQAEYNGGNQYGNSGARLFLNTPATWNGSKHTGLISKAKTGISLNNFGSGNSGNLQPFEVVAYWKRVE